MRIFLNKKGQNTLEYAIIIAVVVAALISMQAYIKRGLQGKLRQSTDDIGEQFSPQAATGNVVTNLGVNSVENLASTSTNTYTCQNQIKNADESTGTLGDDTWWPGVTNPGETPPGG